MNILIILVVGVIFYCVTMLSPSARSTRELRVLNILWSDYNITHDIAYTRKALHERAWKYHQDKVELLHQYMDIAERYRIKKNEGNKKI